MSAKSQRGSSAKGSRAKAPKGLTKSQLVGEVAGKSALTKSQVNSVFVALAEIIGSELKGGRPVTIPGLVKVTAQHKPATPSRPGRNPFTGESITIKAKPARRAVKVRAVKALKDLL
jgi:nucleoid DNA-binding protein